MEEINNTESPWADKTKRIGIILSLSAWAMLLCVAGYVAFSDSASTYQNKKETPSKEESINMVNPQSSTTESYSRTGDRSDDSEYWNSVAREEYLRDMGYDGAANMEKKARLEYQQGGGYHAPDGTPQVQFQGSREQAEQLRQMDELGW